MFSLLDLSSAVWHYMGKFKRSIHVSVNLCMNVFHLFLVL